MPTASERIRALREEREPVFALALDEAEVFALASLVRQALATHKAMTPAAHRVYLKTQSLRADAMSGRDNA